MNHELGIMKLSCFLLLLTFLFVLPSSVLADESANTNASLTINPRDSDFQFSLSSLDSQQTNISQNRILTYQITYGVKQSAGLAANTTIVADFSKDTASDGTDVLDYVAGSATNAYNTSVPVIDLNNRKITWTIPHLPAGTIDQIITFQLKTNTNYTILHTIPFSIHAIITNQYLTLPEQMSNQSYLFHTDTLTGGTAVTPTQIPTPTPVQAQPFQLSTISLQSLTANNIGLFLQTTNPALFTIFYGTSLQNLSQSISTFSYASNQPITLEGLHPQTTYYVKVTATNRDKERIVSDLFTFVTGQTAEAPVVNKDSLSFVSSDIALYVAKNSSQTNAQPLLVIPKATPYNFRFELQKSDAIKSIQAIIRNKNVLGITSSDSEEPNTITTTLIETETGVFEGRLQTPHVPGLYQFFIRISDTHGNITEQPLADMHVTEDFTIKRSDTQEPIEGAQVLLYYRNFRTKQYEILPPELFPVKNPEYTDINGQIHIPLPQGSYKAKITAIGYAQQEVLFTLGVGRGQNYPIVLLKKEPFRIFTTITYYWTIFSDSLTVSKIFIQSLSDSLRFFELNALIVTSSLLFITLLSFSKRIHIPLRSLGDYFLHIGKIRKIQKQLGTSLTGRIFDEESGNVLQATDVFLLDEDKKTVIGHVSTNTQGNFAFSKLQSKNYSLEVMKEGYEPVVFHQSQIHAVELGGYLLSIRKREKQPSFFERLKRFFEKAFALGFETLLVISFICELSLGYTLGWEKAALFLVFSALNLLLWIIHMTHLQNEKNIF